MCKKRMHCMTSFMHHCGNIIHLTCCIHEDKGSTSFCKRTVIATRRFTFAAFQIETMHLIHFTQTLCKEGMHFYKTLFRFCKQFCSCFKWIQWLNTCGL